MDRIAGSYGDVSRGQDVVGKGLRQAPIDAGSGLGPLLGGIGADALALVVAGIVAGPLHELCLLGVGEFVELR
jgi:hypothetical protein